MKTRVRITARPSAPQRTAARAAPLPHKDAMVARFGQRAAHVPVFTGPAVAEALRKRQSDAAALDGVIFLPREDAPADLVAHEIVHALQQGGQKPASAEPEAMLSALERAPALPADSRAETEARVAPALSPGEAPAQSLPAGVVALRRSGEPSPLDRAPAPTPATEAAAPPTQAEAPASEAQTPTEGAGAGGAASDAEIAPTFELPPEPDTTLDPEVAAQRAAEAQAAEEALAAAATPSAVMDAYAGMAPSVKARNMASLGTRLDEANASATAELVESTPEVAADVSGAAERMPSPPPIVVPGEPAGAETVAREDPAILVPEGPEQPVIAVDPSYGSRIERIFASGAAPEQIDENIDAVSTSNPGIERRIADRADVPLEGASDPATMDADAAARRGEASTARAGAAQAVVAGPGPEQVVPRAIEHSAPMAEIAPRPADALTAAPETEQLQQLALPDEVVAGFDKSTAAQMEQSAAATRDQFTTAETQRDTDHAAAVAQADADRASAEAQADDDQRRAVGDQRLAIQNERQRTVDAQASAVSDVNAEAQTARRESRGEADAQIASDRAAIAAEYDQAERDCEAEVARGEREAEAERERKRRESEDQSWWDRAVSFIKDAFEALTRLVTAIFDAVRSVVTAIIDAVRSVVTGLIELAAKALKALVSAFGELLKGLIDNLLGAIFPELAAKLTAFIDDAVALANEAIDAVANTLVAAVNAIAGALTAAVNAVLDVFQSAINAAIALAQAALTGDWSGFLRKILEAVLNLLGIDPQAFYALIAQASDAIEIIVNDPMGFVGNLISAFVGGVQLFADHFLTHLQRGVIGWLTGALGDITLPQEWSVLAVLDIARQVLGLTWDFLRERARRVIGPENVERLEAAIDWIGTLVTEGWSGLWNRIQGELESLKDTVLNAIKEFILERVVIAAITWLASLFNPVGAIVKLVMTIWNVYQFLSNQLQRLMGIAQAVVGMIANIAHGVLGPAMQRVEEVLGNLVPVVIDLLMSLLGVTGVASRVREIIHDVRESIANAADRLIERTMGALGLRRGGPEAAAAGAGAGPEAAGAGQIGHPVRIDVAEGQDHTLSVDRTGAGGATVMLRTDPLPLEAWLTRLAGMADRESDVAKQTSARNDISSARAILAQLDPAADRAASAQAGNSAETEVGALEEQLGTVVTRVFNSLGASPAAAAEVMQSGDVFLSGFAMSSVQHELRLHVEGDRLELEMASASFDGVESSVETALTQARAKNDDKLTKRLGRLLNREIKPFRTFYWEKMGLIVSTRRGDAQVDEAKATAHRWFNKILQSAIDIGAEFDIQSLKDLGHPSAFVLNDEIKDAYRPVWRETFYKSSWSTTIENTWRPNELSRLRTEALTNPVWATHPYVTNPKTQNRVFVVRDKNNMFPTTPYLDLEGPNNVHIDHVQEVADHFQTSGNSMKQDPREKWYELQSNLQILNQRENLRKGGPNVTNWKVTSAFRGPNEP